MSPACRSHHIQCALNSSSSHGQTCHSGCEVCFGSCPAWSQEGCVCSRGPAHAWTQPRQSASQLMSQTNSSANTATLLENQGSWDHGQPTRAHSIRTVDTHGTGRHRRGRSGTGATAAGQDRCQSGLHFGPPVAAQWRGISQKDEVSHDMLGSHQPTARAQVDLIPPPPQWWWGNEAPSWRSPWLSHTRLPSKC